MRSVSRSDSSLVKHLPQRCQHPKPHHSSALRSERVQEEVSAEVLQRMKMLCRPASIICEEIKESLLQLPSPMFKAVDSFLRRHYAQLRPLSFSCRNGCSPALDPVRVLTVLCMIFPTEIDPTRLSKRAPKRFLVCVE